jgi:HSP20 family protein
MAQLLPESLKDALRRLQEDIQSALDRLSHRRTRSPNGSAVLPAHLEGDVDNQGAIDHLRANIHESVNRWLPRFGRRISDAQNDEAWLASMFDGDVPPIDVEEKDNEIVVLAEIPGLDKKDFNVEIANDRLILRGQKKLENQERGRDYYYAERRFGAFTRVIPLPSEVDVKKSSAKYKNGLLRVVLPKANHANGTQIEVRAT